MSEYEDGESSGYADFIIAFDTIAETDIDGPTDAARKHLALKRLLKEAHDKMDELNNNTPDGAVCWFCTESGYDANGLKHKDDCVIVKIRSLIDVNE